MTKDELKLAFQKAFQMGQDYWYHANHEFESYNKKSDAIRAKFNEMVKETIEEVLAQPEQEPVANGKLQVTLQDTPTEIELAQYKRMFAAACADLGEINEALGLDPDDGGAEPILSAIAELKGRSQEPVGWMVYTLDGTSVCVTDNPADFTPEHRALPLYTTPPQRTWVGLTDVEIDDLWESTASYYNTHDFARAIEAKLKQKNGYAEENT